MAPCQVGLTHGPDVHVGGLRRARKAQGVDDDGGDVVGLEEIGRPVGPFCPAGGGAVAWEMPFAGVDAEHTNPVVVDLTS